MLTEIIEKLNIVQKEMNEQEKVIAIASKTMKESHDKINKIIRSIRKMENGPMTHNERLILQQLYEVTSLISNAAADIKFGPQI